MYEEEEEPRLSTLTSTPRRPAQQTEGSLLGDEFTSPHSKGKGE